MWFFVRRRWANRVTAKQGLHAAGKETSLLVELMIWAAKQNEQTAYAATGTRLPKADAILQVAIGMVRNPTAVRKIGDDLGIDALAAHLLLVGLREAAIKVATEHGFTRLVQAEAGRP